MSCHKQTKLFSESRQLENLNEAGGKVSAIRIDTNFECFHSRISQFTGDAFGFEVQGQVSFDWPLQELAASAHGRIYYDDL